MPVTQLNAATNELAHAWPRFLPDGRHFLFVALTPAVQRVIEAGSLDAAGVTEVLRVNSNPVYSPSGHLLFHRDGTLMAQGFDVTSLKLSGEPVRLAEALAFNPQNARGAMDVSTTGVLVTRGGAAFEQTQLTWFDRSGKRIETVGEPAVYRGLGLSPDNRFLAVHIHAEPTGGDIWVIDRQRGTSTKFTFNAHNFAPSWSRDAKYILFTSDKEGPLNLYRKAATGVGSEEMTFGSGGAAFVEDITKDGKWMVYGQGGGKTGIDVWRVPLTDKGKPELLVSSSSFDGLAKISPDEKWLAYESDESGRREIYVQPFPKGTTKYPISTDGGRYVKWSPKGGEIFYLKDDGSLMSTEVKSDGDALVLGKPVALFKTNPLMSNHRGSALDIPYDVTQDGQRFLINERLTTGTVQFPISVVVNWPALLPKD